ncbi:MAG: hypothetical protein K9K21_07300, partial [Desulfotignum sp.]|nr:hypothetical protein [Desulfotignum sp.]
MRDSQKGSVLLIVIAGITILAAIGAGVATMVGSGARTGADHSLSVQAIYAAESGLEWARFKLREAHNDPGDSWENYCQNALTSEGSDVNIGGQVFFSIDGANLSPVGGPPYDGCEVSVTGWV